MVKIQEISRTSTFAWSLDNLPLLATGTVAGAVDIDFNSSSVLEIWDIFGSGDEKVALFSASVDNRFYSLVWSQPFDGRPRGLLAGAFENGLIEFWDAQTLIKTRDLNMASVHRSNKHTGAVRTLLFNPTQPHILVSGGSNGEIFVWDVKTFSEPFSPGQAMTPMDDITCVAWNNSVSHIFASTGNGGFTSIWDLKSKREVLHLSYSNGTGRANFSSVAWHPTQSTKLVTASENDSCSVILTWDLRNSNAPEKVMNTSKGVISLDWCKQDPELLLSSGKDNTTVLWNPVEGTKLGSYPTTANWAFLTRFAPAIPEVFAIASFDGKIVVQSLQDTSPPISSKVVSSNDAEFWSEISTAETQQPVFEHLQAPAWLKNPTSVSFGFGSKLVFVRQDSTGKSIVSIEQITPNTSIRDSSSRLEEALKARNFEPVISANLTRSLAEADGLDWKLLKEFSEVGKEKLFREAISLKGTEQGEDSQVNEVQAPINQEADFFESLGNENGKKEDVEAFAPKGKFSLFDETSEDDKSIIKLLLSKKTEEAVDICLKQDKLVEALVLALDSSDSVKLKVRNKFFKSNSDNLARVIYSVSSSNITDIVANANVANWVDIAASIESFCSDRDEFDSKITELGDRILDSSESVEESRKDAMLCYMAGNSLEKIAGLWLQELSDLEEELLKSGDSRVTTPSDARYCAISNFIEKITTYRGIANISNTFQGPYIEPIGKAILEYCNLVAGLGKFELADILLSLLPDDFNGLKAEKERIYRASNKPKSSGVLKSDQGTARGQYSGKFLPKVEASLATNGHSSSSQIYNASISGQTPGTGYVPKASSIPKSPLGSFSRPVPSYQHSGAQVSLGQHNPYKPSVGNPIGTPVPSFPTTNGPPAPPPKSATRQETEGWNDLPNTFKPKTGRRPAPVVAPAPSATSKALSSTSIPKTPSFAPPPPKGISRTSSRTSVPSQANLSAASSPRISHAPPSNKYAPAVAPNGMVASPDGNVSAFNGGHGSPMPVPPPSKVAYQLSTSAAPPPRNMYAPPPVSPGIASGMASADTARLVPAMPPKNPYAPPAAAMTTVSSGGSVPTPRMGGIVSPPPSLANYSGGVPPPMPNMRSNSMPFSPPPPPIGPKKTTTGEAFAQGNLTEPVVQSKPSFPPGDRSHIKDAYIPIYETLNTVLEEVKPRISERYARHGVDMERRLNMLFDHLNNDDLLSEETIRYLLDISSALKSKEYTRAAALNIEIATNHSEETLDWHTGVKRLIQMAEALLQ